MLILFFCQRGDKLSPDLFSGIKIPIIFWSTEPINLKNDVDSLLSSNIFHGYLYTLIVALIESRKSFLI